ncbi:uncharacterized protein J4E92_001864 [Alternaria infectoria]|uniref:uncharacterized protein n=1 Tax=Alternaria infectoria TaxID=45303 RepID=UPI002220CE76|nr:uncharacterized protein J4E92_001864 [Alternaria infectoria]KAI4937137.1 hypothetical protein J4E92_001864 [Alternaria infectoria]
MVNTINQVASDENIRAVISFDNSLSDCSPNIKNGLITKTILSGRRVFVICILGKIPIKYLRVLLEEDLVTDSELPIAQKRVTSGFANSPYLLASFLRAQFRLEGLSQMPTQGRFHQQIDEAHTVPISVKSRLYDSLRSSVYEMQIMFPGTNFPLPPGQDLVIKQAYPHATECGTEREFLQALADNNISHPHIVTSYTGFQFRTGHYVVSERGSGNLLKFMPKYTDGAQAGLDYDWVVRQFMGLTDALSKIHGPTTKGNNGLYRNIGLDNILVFAKNDLNLQDSTLKFCGWSCAKMTDRERNEETSEASSEQASDKPVIGTYNENKPSEVIRGWNIAVSRDIERLGLAFLEVLVWFHEGEVKMSDFVEQHRYRWNDIVPGGLKLARTVQQKIKEIGDRGAEWKTVVDIIGQMLQVNVVNTSRASDVVTALGSLLDT